MTEDANAPLLSTRQVARLFGCTDRTIRNWVHAGHLRPVRVGRSVFFRRDEVESLAGFAGLEGKNNSPENSEY